eukprot:6784055-Lingulodinium_polyedra.AAC.1
MRSARLIVLPAERGCGESLGRRASPRLLDRAPERTLTVRSQGSGSKLINTCRGRQGQRLPSCCLLQSWGSWQPCRRRKCGRTCAHGPWAVRDPSCQGRAMPWPPRLP